MSSSSDVRLTREASERDSLLSSAERGVSKAKHFWNDFTGKKTPLPIDSLTHYVHVWGIKLTVRRLLDFILSDNVLQVAIGLM